MGSQVLICINIPFRVTLNTILILDFCPVCLRIKDGDDGKSKQLLTWVESLSYSVWTTGSIESLTTNNSI